MAAFLCLEAAMERAPVAGTGKFCLTVDLHGLGLRDLNPATATTCCSAILTHYPGQIGQVCILDAPFVFKAIWSLLTPMIPEETAKRVQMLRGEAMNQYFERHFSAEQSAFMMETLFKLPARPGSLPESLSKLRQPLNNRPTQEPSGEP
jgi:hypothetical protein